MSLETVTTAIHLTEGIGGRLGTPKSPAYRRLLSEVESRATPFVLPFMIASDLAYVLTNRELGLVDDADARVLLRVLLELQEAGPDAFAGQEAIDVLTLREAWAIARTGREIGAQLHAGRNRTESLKHYLPKLYFRDALSRQRLALLDVIEALLDQGERHRDTLAPVYHHLQHAMVSTLGEYLLSWAANLLEHLDRIDDADRRLDFAPSVNNERPELLAIGRGVARRLGFTRAQVLRHQQHATEDQFAEPFFVLAATTVALARLAEDLRVWMTTEFGFFEPDDRDASGSSGLPQKKNPFGLQAVFGAAAVGAGRLAAQLSTSIAPSEGLESAFAAASLYQHADDMIAVTGFMAELIREGSFDAARLEEFSFIGDAMMSEATDSLVFDHGVPFRLAHHALGRVVRAMHSGAEPPEIIASLEEATGHPIGLTDADLQKLLASRDVPLTSRTPAAVEQGLLMIRTRLDSERARRDAEPVARAVAALTREAQSVLDEGVR